MLLRDLRQNIAQLKGLGAKACQNLSRLGIEHIGDLLQHFPRRYVDRRKPFSLQDSLTAAIQTANKPEAEPPSVHCLAEVLEHRYIPWRGGYASKRNYGGSHSGQALKILVRDDSGTVASLLCFGRNFIANQLPVGQQILLAGKFQLRYEELQSSSFTYEVPENPNAPYKEPVAKESGSFNDSEFGTILPFYSLTQGVSQKLLRSVIAQALQHFSFAIEDEVPESLRRKHDLLSKCEALRQIHFPQEQLARAHKTLVYEELLLLMLLIQRRRLQQNKQLQSKHVFQLQGEGALLVEALSALPFSLSSDQEAVLKEILDSFGKDIPMNRLLQGDVGSGKTIVALLSALPWLESGAQVVLMAPTELLARQLSQNFEKLRHSLEQRLEKAGANFLEASEQLSARLGESGFLSGSVTGAKRKEILRKLKSGELRLLIGTHALFSQAVEFANLRYIIVDEQHRFGVEQRLALKHKAPHPPHILLMSATPIPRTLALTLYGDLDISSICSMPAERKPIKTHLVRQGNDAKVYDFVRRELAEGRQAYFIYPLIEDSEELRSVQQMRSELGQVFSEFRLEILHGQMPDDEKNRIMEAFRKNEVQVLLATTVLEVGVDVPNASVMVVEHAEQFGLGQLHQLRGRVGRGAEQGFCFLVYCERSQGLEAGSLTPLAKERLLTLKDCSDGFTIAEKDLELRGPGDLLGVEQSGSMDLRIAKIPEDLPILEQAKLDAEALLQRDYGFLQPEHKTLRELMLHLNPKDMPDI